MIVGVGKQGIKQFAEALFQYGLDGWYFLTKECQQRLDKPSGSFVNGQFDNRLGRLMRYDFSAVKLAVFLNKLS